MLPPLRQDLSLHAGPAAEGGAPSWTLHDPAANRFYRLEWPAFELLSRWGLGHPVAILQSVQRETTLRLDGHDFASLMEFLARHHLFEARTAADTARLGAAARAAKLSKARWLLRHYLFFRIPILRPTAFLERWSPYLAWTFHPRFWGAVAAAAVLGLILASRQWDAFVHTFSAYASWSGVLAIALAVSAAKVLHELGHAFTAQRYGCRVPTMGVAFLVMWPVLYTDTNEAWKLTDKRQRLAIGAAGMLTELALAAAATLAWSFLPPGPLRSGAFLLATTTWVLTLAINASPFMRFDGYFLLSDWMDFPNLHGRAFAMGRWWMRRVLFGWNDPPPEQLPPRRRRFLIVFAYATWLYRLVLFLGIALLVYHFFFKLAGIVLMAVELGWFIGLPIWSELRHWWTRRGALRWNRATRRLAAGLALLLALVCLPWQNRVSAPAVMGAAHFQALYAIAPARIVSPPPPAGTPVPAGHVLVRLESPDLAHRLAKAQQREANARWQLEQQPFHPQLLQQGAALQERWAEAAAEVAGLQAQIAQLTVKAPFAGRVADVAEGLIEGAWVADREKLLHVIGEAGTKGEAFVGEAELDWLQAGGSVRFIPRQAGAPALSCRVETMDRVNLAALDSPALASVHGGPIPVQRDRDGALIPNEALFRVRIGGCDDAAAPPHELHGSAHLQSAWHGMLGPWLRRAFSALQRETGF